MALADINYVNPSMGGGQAGQLPSGPGFSPGYPSHGLPGGGHPAHPIALPPLPGINPKPGEPSLPIYLPPEISVGVPTQPIYIEDTPEHPIALPPNTVYPPLDPPVPVDPGFGVKPKKIALFIYVPGVGGRWLIYDPSATPPVAQPK